MTTHGMSKTPEYRAWQEMNQRCYNPKSEDYLEGISVCSAWRNSFEAFLSDVGTRPSESHCLSRIDNSGNYEPGNCRWVDRKTKGLTDKIRKDNNSGFKGVSWHSRKKTWRAYIKIDGRVKHLGYFSTPEAANEYREKYLKDLIESRA